MHQKFKWKLTAANASTAGSRNKVDTCKQTVNKHTHSTNTYLDETALCVCVCVTVLTKIDKQMCVCVRAHVHDAALQGRIWRC